FFQAEDGIRDRNVTGVQTCALPISRIAEASISAFLVNVAPSAVEHDPSGLALARANTDSIALLDGLAHGFDVLVRHHIELGFRRSEERRVGKGGRSGGRPA